MKKHSWSNIRLYFTPLLLTAVALASLALTFREGPEFPAAPDSKLAPQTDHLANFARFSFTAQDILAEEIETIKGISDFDSYTRFQNSIYDITQTLPNTSCLAIKEGDFTIYSKPAPIGLRSASGQKLFTALAALLVLGEDYTYTTEVRAFSRPVNGVLEGSLYLVGSGDPLFWTDRFFQYRNNLTPGLNRTSADALANQLVSLGLRSITGSVVGVETKYDEVRYPPSWPRSFRGGNVAGALSALSINHGYVLINDAWISDRNPAMSSAAVFDDLLEFRGVVIPRAPFTSSITPPIILTSIESPPLKEILQTILSVSDNTAAELLLKEIGLGKRGEGSTREGIHAVVDALIEAGIYPNVPQILPGDGSGVAETNRVTCEELVTILEYGQENFSLSSTLATAGESGTLQNRFTDSPIRGKLFAKTGTWAGLASLSGYVIGDDGRQVNFSYISNDSGTAIFSSEERAMLETALAETIWKYLVE